VRTRKKSKRVRKFKKRHPWSVKDPRMSTAQRSHGNCMFKGKEELYDPWDNHLKWLVVDGNQGAVVAQARIQKRLNDAQMLVDTT